MQSLADDSSALFSGSSDGRSVKGKILYLVNFKICCVDLTAGAINLSINSLFSVYPPINVPDNGEQ